MYSDNIWHKLLPVTLHRYSDCPSLLSRKQSVQNKIFFKNISNLFQIQNSAIANAVVSYLDV